MKKPSTRPRGFTSLTPSLAVSDVSVAIRFLTDAFGAEVENTDHSDTPGFAMLKIGNAKVFLSGGWQAHGHMPADLAQTTPISLYHYVDSLDAVLELSLAAGAVLVSEPQDMPWSERIAVITDPMGLRWSLAERIELPKEKDQVATAEPAKTVVADSEIKQEAVEPAN